MCILEIKSACAVFQSSSWYRWVESLHWRPDWMLLAIQAVSLNQDISKTRCVNASTNRVGWWYTTTLLVLVQTCPCNSPTQYFIHNFRSFSSNLILFHHKQLTALAQHQHWQCFITPLKRKRGRINHSGEIKKSRNYASTLAGSDG